MDFNMDGKNPTPLKPPLLQDIRVPFDLMAQDPRTEDPRNQDLKDFAKATPKSLDEHAWMLMATRNPAVLNQLILKITENFP